MYQGLLIFPFIILIIFKILLYIIIICLHVIIHFSNLHCMLAHVGFPKLYGSTSQFCLRLERIIIYVRQIGVSGGWGFHLNYIPHKCDVSTEGFEFLSNHRQAIASPCLSCSCIFSNCLMKDYQVACVVLQRFKDHKREKKNFFHPIIIQGND